MSGRGGSLTRLHPAALTLWFCGILAASVFFNAPLFLGLFLIGSLFLSGYLYGGKKLLTDMRTLFFLLVFVTALNALFTHNGKTVLFYIGNGRVTAEAVLFGLTTGLMLAAVLFWFSCFSLLMSSDKLIWLFGRITPVLGLTVSMIFRFVPLLKQRFQEIRAGQIALGRAEVKSPLQKIRQFAKEVSILISWSLESSIESADSMAARGYGLKGRTSFHLFRWRTADIVWVLVTLFLEALLLIFYMLDGGKWYYYPTARPVQENMPLPETGIFFAVGGIFVLLPVLADLWGAYLWKRTAKN